MQVWALAGGTHDSSCLCTRDTELVRLSRVGNSMHRVMLKHARAQRPGKSLSSGKGPNASFHPSLPCRRHLRPWRRGTLMPRRGCCRAWRRGWRPPLPPGATCQLGAAVLPGMCSDDGIGSLPGSFHAITGQASINILVAAAALCSPSLAASSVPAGRAGRRGGEIVTIALVPAGACCSPLS